MTVTLYRGFRLYRVLYVVVPIAYLEFSKLTHATNLTGWWHWIGGGAGNHYYAGKVRFALCIAMPLLLFKLGLDLYSRFVRKSRLLINSSMIIDEISPLSTGSTPWSDIESFDVQRSLLNASVDIRFKAGPGTDATRLQIGGLGISAAQAKSIREMTTVLIGHH